MMRRALALVVALGACGGEAATPGEGAWVPVVRDDLVLEVDVTGTLRATRSSPIGTPSVPDMRDFKIVRMASEGTEVKRGDTVLVFDSSELHRQLAERRSERDAAAQEIVKKRIDLDLRRREGELRLAEAEAALRKATLKADLPPEYTAAVEVKLARIDLDAAQAELTGARRRLEYQLRLGDAELAFLRDRHARWQARVERLEEAVKQMKVVSPADGLVVYPMNWRGDKRKVGDSCWSGEGCVEVVDVSQMMGKGEVDETEAARVRPGQRVTFRLEALPEVAWEARIEGIRPAVYRQSPRNPLKVIGVDLALDRTDPVRMRPGMLFRGRVETGRVTGALLVPIEAVHNRPEGPIAFRRTPVGHERVALELGRRNARFVEVRAGLAEGDRVARRDLEQEEPR